MVIYIHEDAQVRFRLPDGVVVVAATHADGVSLDLDDDDEDEPWLQARVALALQEGGRPIPYWELRQRLGR